ncbi:MAG TPA: PAC2 family protein [Actinomycetota bacterium]|nr:PAC2 family protein [Actinomycetota bacterium]
MTLLRIGALPGDLVAPVMVVAFDGWVDAAGASSAAAEHLADGGELVVTFDDDALFDYRSRRPTLDIIDGTLHRLQWPALQIHHRSIGGRDLLILHGPEPDFRWKELGDAVGEFCLRAGVVEWISLGAIPAAVPHTRPVPVLASASRDGLLHESETKGPPGLLRVPSAALSAIEFPLTQTGVPAVGFYAQVPHYIGGPYAAASVSLLRHLSRHLGVELPIEELEEEADAQRRRLDAAVEGDDDVREILQRLEQNDAEEIPSGDELAAEIERFLRGQTDPG